MENKWGEWEQMSLVNYELKMGEKLARQLQIHLNSPSFTREAHEELMQKILDSFAKARSMLNLTSAVQLREPTVAPGGVGLAFTMSEAPTSPTVGSRIKDSDWEFKHQEINKDGLSRKRKTVPTWTKEVRVTPEKGLEGPPNDGYSWRKYGEKEILGAKYPRGYYRCNYRNSQGCWAAKQVQRSDHDPNVYEIIYRGSHTCNQANNIPPPPGPPQPQKITRIWNAEPISTRELLFNFPESQKIITQDLDTSQENSFFPNSFHFSPRKTTTPMVSSSILHQNSIMSNLSSPFMSPSTSVAGTVVSNSSVSSCSRACRVSGGEELVSCRRLENISKSKQDLRTVDTPISRDCSVAKVPTQYLRKLVDLPLDVYPSRPFELIVRAECLLELYLSCGDEAQFQDLVNLKLVDLSNSNFTRMPDLSGSSKLQSLSLQGCANVVEVSWVQYLSKLKYLNLKGCVSLRSLPSVIALACLSSLDLSDCTNLRRLPPSLGSLSSLTSLDLRNCKRIHDLPRSILRLNSLQGLSISGCSRLMEHLSGIGMSSSVESFNRDSEEGISPEEQQPGYLSSASKRTDIEVLSQAEVPSLDQPISKHNSKSSLQQPGEEGNGNKSDSKGEVKPSLKRTSHEMESTGSEDETKPSSPPTQKLAMISTQPRTSRPSSSSKNSNVILSSALVHQKEALKWYMDMSVEAIHQAGAFDDVERIVETLIQQSTDSHESANLEDLLHCLGDIQESVPDTLAHMNAAQTYRESVLVKLADLGLRLVEAAEEYNLLGAKFATLSEEEEKLEAEIQRLMANKEELLHAKN